MTELERWTKDKGDETLRLDYELNDFCTVMDFGGYEGEWTNKIWERYHPKIHVFDIVPEFAENLEARFAGNVKIEIHNYGLSNMNRDAWVAVEGITSTTYSPVSDNLIKGQLIDVKLFFDDYDIDRVHLMKLNIEGGEYDLLKRLIDTDIIYLVDNIQVQFHNTHCHCEMRRNDLTEKLKKTHKITWQYDWVWENWKRLGL